MGYFVDFNKLRMGKCKNASLQINIPLKINLNNTYKEIEEGIISSFAALNEHDEQDFLCLNFSLEIEDPKEEEADFEDCTNLILSTFVHWNTLAEERKREHHYDMPREWFDYLFLNRGLAKLMTNRNCKIDCFNIHIDWKEYHYDLLDEAAIEKKKGKEIYAK